MSENMSEAESLGAPEASPEAEPTAASAPARKAVRQWVTLRNGSLSMRRAQRRKDLK